GAKMKAVGHVDDHGGSVWKLVKRLRRNQHAAQRFDRQIDASHLREWSRPCSGTVNHRACGNRVARGRNLETRILTRDPGYAGVLPERGAVIACPGHKADHGAVGIDKAIRGAETAANDVVATELRKQAANFVAGDEAHTLQSHGNLLFVIR